MLKRLPILCAALLALAACSHDNGASSATQPATPTTTSSATPAPAASTAPASATTVDAPAAATSAAATASSTAVEKTAMTASATAAVPFVDNGKWVEGKNYFLIEPAQPTTHPDKIEVTEVFSYGCPACNAFHATATQIAQSLPANTVMTYLPASFIPQENWPMLQRAYFAAQALGIAEKAHGAMFDAMWKTQELSSMKPTGGLKPAAALPTIEDAAKVYAKYGADPKEFVAIANSFAVNTKMKRADDLIKAYGVDGTPSMVINGKYRFGVASAGGYPQAIELTQWLVAKEAAGK